MEPDPRSTALSVPDPRERARFAEFVARVTQLDPAAAVRLRFSGATGLVHGYASTPFDVLAGRAVPGSLEPADVVAPAVGLLTALAVERAATVDPGVGGPWRGPLPPESGWIGLTELPAAELVELVEQGRREVDGPPSAAVLDRTVRTVPDPSGGRPVAVPLRCLFALSGLGLLDRAEAGEAVGPAATRDWLRLRTDRGDVFRRRLPTLPLLT